MFKIGRAERQINKKNTTIFIGVLFLLSLFVLPLAAEANYIFYNADTGLTNFSKSIYAPAGYFNGSIGIGTTNPISKLHIAGTPGSVAGSGITFSGSTAIWQSSASDLRIRPAGVDIATFISTGVGISSSTPNFKLGISGATGDVINVGGGQVAGLNSTQFNNDQAVSLGYLKANYFATSSSLWGGTKNGNIWNGDAGLGNVGIGTTAPGAKLQVSGDIALTGGSALYSFGTGDMSSADSRWGNFYNIGAATRFLTSGKGTYSASVPDMYFSKWNGSVLTDMMFIQSSSGNVGIGTTTPTDKLTISPITYDINQNGGIKITDVGNHWAGRFSLKSDSVGNPRLAIDYPSNSVGGSVEGISIKPSGNVGIGTTTPDAVLGFASSTVSKIDIHNGYVRGLTIVPVDRTDAASKGYLDDNFAPKGTGVGSAFVQGGNSFATTATLGTNDNNHLIFETNSAARMTIYNNGNVGIGTSNPGARLEITPGASGYGQIINGGASGSLRWGSGAQGALSWDTNKSIVTGLAGHALSLGSNGSWDRIYIATSSNVGIGTTAPNGLLSLKSNYALSMMSGTSGYGAGLRYDTNSSETLVIGATNAATKIMFATGYNVATSQGTPNTLPVSPTMTISGANIGIGTTTPTTKLYVNGGTGDVINVGGGSIAGLNSTPINNDQAVPLGYLKSNYLSNSSTSTGWLLGGNSLTSDTSFLGSTNNYDVLFKTNNTERMRILKNGNVGIGTSNPENIVHFKGAGIVFRVEPTDNARGGVYFGNGGMFSGNEAGMYDVGGDIPLVVYDAESERVRYGNVISVNDSAGTVGLGVTDPQYRLEVEGLGEFGETGSSMTLGFDSIGGDVGLSDPDNSIIVAGKLNGVYRYGGYEDDKGLSVATSGNVGISTTTPAVKLHISGGTGDIINVGGGQVAGLNSTQFNNDQAVSLGYLKANYNASTTNFWGGSLTGNIGNSNTGNVGVGTSTPSNKFQVYGNGTYSASFLNGNVGIGVTNPSSLLQIGNDAVNPTIILESTSTGNDATVQSAGIEFGEVPSARGSIWYTGDGYMHIGMNNRALEYMRFSYNTNSTWMYGNTYFPGNSVWNSSGNIGIGTTTPDAKLDIAGPSTVDGSSIILRSAVSPTYNWELRRDNLTTGNLFLDRSSGGAAATIVTFQQGGNVGIGTTTATTKLYLNGGTGDIINVNGGQVAGLNSTQFNNDQAVSLGYLKNNYFATSSSLWGGTKNGNIWNGDAGLGSVGIGTSTPAYKLDVAGNARIGEIILDPYMDITKQSVLETSGGYNAAYNGLWLGSNQRNRLFAQANSSLSSWAVDIGGFDNGTFSGSADSFNIFRMPAGGSYSRLFTINSSGNVGIGTTSPATKLNIYGTSNAIRTSYDGTKYSEISADSGGNATWHSTGYLMMKGDSGTGDLSAVSGSSLRILGDPSGVVGNGVYIKAFKTGFPWYVGFQYLNSAGIPDLALVPNGGNVGIASTSPVALLGIAGSGRVINIGGGRIGGMDITPLARDEAVSLGFIQDNYRPTSTTDNLWSLTGNALINDTSFLGSTNNYDVLFKTNNTERMRILKGGNIGIGTSTPSAKVHIVGPALTSNAETSYGLWVSNINAPKKAIILGYDTTNDVGLINAVDQGVNWRNIAFQTNGGNVSVGTTTSIGKLAVVGGASAALVVAPEPSTGNIYLGSLSSYNYLSLSGDNSIGGYNFLSRSTDKNLYINRPTGNAIQFRENNNPQVIILSGGNVGIASTTPIARLGIASSTNNVINVGGGSIGGLDLTPVNNDQAVPLGYLKSNYNASTTSFWGGSLTGNISSSNTGNVGVGTSTPSNKFQVYGNGTYSASFLNGNVGIGITNPVARLEIVGTETHVSGDLSGSDALLRLFNDNSSDVAEKGAVITFEDKYLGTNRTTRAAIKGGTVTAGNNADGFLAFYTDSGSANSMQERMRINQLGNVGIGTSVPGANLNVSGGMIDSTGKTLAILGEPNTGTYAGSDVLHYNSYWSLIQSRDNTGNTNSAGKLIFRGVGRYSDVVQNVDILTLSQTGTSGSVGIGTTTPSQKLEVVGNIKLSGAGTKVIGMSRFDNGGTHSLQTQNGYLELSLSGSEPFSINGGNVGIGTTTPNAVLGFASSSVSKIDIHNGYVRGLSLVPVDKTDATPKGYVDDNFAPKGTGIGSAFVLGGNSFATTTTLGTNDNNHLIFKTNNIARMTIYNNGNVGIGTTVPIQRLQIGTFASVSTTTPETLSLGATFSNTAASNLKLRVYDDNASTIGGLGVSAGQLEVATWAAGKIAFYRGTNQTMVIDASSNVGIGTNPSYKLHVAGDIYTPNSYRVGETAQVVNDSLFDAYRSSSATSSNIYGGKFFRYLSGVTNSNTIYGVHAQAGPSTGATMTSAIGVYGNASAFGSGVLTNAYSIYASSPTGNVTNAFNIYANGAAKNYFGGNVGIASTSPVALLGIAGSGRVINIGGGRIGGMDITPLARDEAVSLGYILDNYQSTSTIDNLLEVSVYVGSSVTNTTGNNNNNPGYDVAFGLCETDYTGSHVCTPDDMLNTIKHGALYPSTNVWIFSGPPGYTASANDCNGRRGSATNDLGAYWEALSSDFPKGRGLLMACNQSLKIACCR